MLEHLICLLLLPPDHLHGPQMRMHTCTTPDANMETAHACMHAWAKHPALQAGEMNTYASPLLSKKTRQTPTILNANAQQSPEPTEGNINTYAHTSCCRRRFHALGRTVCEQATLAQPCCATAHAFTAPGLTPFCNCLDATVAL